MTGSSRFLSGVVAALAPILVLAGGGAPLAAQCASECVQSSCGGGWHAIGDEGGYGKVCHMGTYCSEPDECTAEEDQEQEIEMAIAGLESAATIDDLRAVVTGVGHRLVVNAERDMVVILGGCKDDVPTFVTAMTEEQTLALARMGLPTYTDFLRAQAASLGDDDF